MPCCRYIKSSFCHRFNICANSTSNGKDDSIPFKSIQSSSSYWGVYENANKLEFQKTVHIWDSWLGIEVNSASAGFTSQQAKKAIDDVKKIRNSKNILKIKVINDTDELSNINDGIEEWSDENIGDIEKDAWFNAGSRKLEIRDSREPIHVPHDTIISNLANNTNGLLKWYKQNKDKVNKTESDLTIVENLKQHNHKIEKNMLCNSVISRSGLLRYRLRKNNFYDSSNDNEIYIYESLSGITYSNDSLSKLIALVEKGAEKNDISRQIGHYFSPRIEDISRESKSSAYLALSSSIVDPACCFNTIEDSYIWEYELPNYSADQGLSNGFYLMVNENETLIKSIKKLIRFN